MQKNHSNKIFDLGKYELIITIIIATLVIVGISVFVWAAVTIQCIDPLAAQCQTLCKVALEKTCCSHPFKF